MSERVDVGQQDDWHFDQATEIAAGQIGTSDLIDVSDRLVDAAAKIGESVYDTALMVVEGRLRLAGPGRDATVTSKNDHQRALAFDGTTFIAQCVCGWRSARFSDPGLASSLYDVHVEARRQRVSDGEPH